MCFGLGFGVVAWGAERLEVVGVVVVVAVDVVDLVGGVSAVLACVVVALEDECACSFPSGGEW